MKFNLEAAVQKLFSELLEFQKWKLRVVKDYHVILESALCCISFEDDPKEASLSVAFYHPLNKFNRFDSGDLMRFRNEPQELRQKYLTAVKLTEPWSVERKMCALQSVADQTLKYRKDILSGDFESWLSEFKRKRGS